MGGGEVKDNILGERKVLENQIYVGRGDEFRIAL